MIPRAETFRRWYVSSGGAAVAAAAYMVYLNRVDRVCGGIDSWLAGRSIEALLEWLEAQPHSSFGGLKNWRDSRSALRKYRVFLDEGLTEHRPAAPERAVPPLVTAVTVARTPAPSSALAPASRHVPVPRTAEELRHQAEVLSLLRQAKVIGARYYAVTGKPLGVTGEVAELEAAEKLGLRLCAARTPGFDAWDERVPVPRRIQIKGRAVDPDDRYRGRCPAIKCGDLFDDVLLVLLDRVTLDALEIWSASEAEVIARLIAPGSKARNERDSLAIAQFKSIARRVWPA